MIAERGWDSTARKLVLLASTKEKETPFPARFETPELRFDCEPHIGEFPCHEVAFEARAQAAGLTASAFGAACARFPLVIGCEDGFLSGIRSIRLGFTEERDRVLSASSPEGVGSILLAANWRQVSLGKLASLIVHESIHQLLFTTGLSPTFSERARPHSFGFSPWKESHRPGWLVLHAYWSFACQFQFLTGLEQPDVPTAFLADMDARLRLCFASIGTFQLASRDECARLERAHSVFLSRSDQLSEGLEYRDNLHSALGNVRASYNNWAGATVAASS